MFAPLSAAAFGRDFRTGVNDRRHGQIQRFGDVSPANPLAPQLEGFITPENAPGHPRRVPRAFAARTPAQTRSRIIPRSISAKAANRCLRLDIWLSTRVDVMLVVVLEKITGSA